MKPVSRLVAPLLAALASACQPPARTAAGPAPVCPQPVVLVTIDGVRWHEVFQGVDPVLGHQPGWDPVPPRDERALLPNLHRLVDRGLALGAPGRGAPVLASGPNFVSLPGYIEILSGRPALGCPDNGCGMTDRPTLLDELRGQAGLGMGDVAVVASWEVTEQAAALDPAQITISAGRSGGPTRDRLAVDNVTRAILDDAVGSPPFPGYGDYRPDRYTGPLALAYLWARRPCFLYVELGDTDEYAHRRDYPAYVQSIGEFDDFLGQLDATLLAMGDGARTLVLVTTDHGRELAFQNHGADPASQRVWLVAAGGPIIPAGPAGPAGPTGPAPAAEPRRLADLAPTLRRLFGLAPDRSVDAGAPLPELLGLCE